MPVSIVPTPIVAMTALILTFVTRKPFTRPMMMPTRSASATANGIGKCSLAMRPATTRPMKLATLPMLRSNSPTTSVNVSPAEMMAVNDA